MTSQDARDKKLVHDVLVGKQGAFDTLVRHYQNLVAHIIFSLIPRQEDRQDICQDVFLKVYQKLDTFQFRAKLSTWVGNIAFNTALNFLEKRKRTTQLDIATVRDENDEIQESIQNSIPDTSSPPDEILINQEQKQQLSLAIDTLPPIQRTILLLFHRDELTLDEISMTLGFPTNTIKSHLFRARKQLRKIIVPEKIK